MRSPFSGRFVGKGLTPKSTAIGAVVILGAIGGLMVFLREQIPPIGVDVEVISSEVVSVGEDCEWLIEVEVTNTDDRGVLVVAAWLENLPDSRRGLLSSIAGPGADQIAYRLPLDDCQTDPADLDVGDLVVMFRQRAGSVEHTVTAEVP